VDRLLGDQEQVGAYFFAMKQKQKQTNQLHPLPIVQEPENQN